MRGEWGHLGPFDFGVGVRNLDIAVARLRTLGIELVSEPQTIQLGGGATWGYAYFADPDGTRVCLTEGRY
jgi:catechol 2,3-dioxygenase-like lactoylglutathione lyase family enzyme